jgi:hypothetical protein
VIEGMAGMVPDAEAAGIRVQPAIAVSADGP